MKILGEKCSADGLTMYRQLSPAIPAAILLHGIVFGFAFSFYSDIQWTRTFTVLYYSVVCVMAIVALLSRLRSNKLTLNRFDYAFTAFVLLVLGSVATHWWHGTVQYLLYFPVFAILPYLLGRFMAEEDVRCYWRILLTFAVVLLCMMPVEYWRNVQPGFKYALWPIPILFDIGHGAMLSGLLLTPVMLLLASLTLRKTMAATAFPIRRISAYSLIGVIVLVLGWASSRGPVLAGSIGLGVLFVLSRFSNWRRRAELLVVIAIFVALAALNASQKQSNLAHYKAILNVPDVAVGDLPGRASAAHIWDWGEEARVKNQARHTPILGADLCKTAVDSVSERWLHIQTAIVMFQSWPIWGAGANSYGFYSCAGPGWYPHSTILQALAELGVVGAASHVAVLLLALFAAGEGYRQARDDATRQLFAWLTAFLVFQIIVAQLYGNYFMSAALYFSVGMVASLYQRGAAR